MALGNLAPVVVRAMAGAVAVNCAAAVSLSKTLAASRGASVAGWSIGAPVKKGTSEAAMSPGDNQSKAEASLPKMGAKFFALLVHTWLYEPRAYFSSSACCLSNDHCLK